MVFNETKKLIMKKVLKKIVKELYGASKMHESQGDRIKKLLNRKDNVAITTMMGKVKCKDYRSSVAKFIEPAQIVIPTKKEGGGLNYSTPAIDPSPQVEFPEYKKDKKQDNTTEEKDDNENTGRGGKGPKPMKVQGERKNDKDLIKEQKLNLKNTTAAEEEKGQKSKVVTKNTPQPVVGVDASGNPLKSGDVADGEGLGNILKEMVVNSK